MPIVERGSTFQVTVHRADAKPGYRRIRRQRHTRADAEALEQEIERNITTHGKWPIGRYDKPLPVRPLMAHKQGTLRVAAGHAKRSHQEWVGTEYGAKASLMIAAVVDFMEARGRKNLHDINSDDLLAYTEYRRSQGNTNSTINKHLSTISVIFDEAVNRTPPLCDAKPAIKRCPDEYLEKWWLRPEDQVVVLKLLRDNDDFLFADFLELTISQGCRITETLGLRPGDFTGMDTDRPLMKISGREDKQTHDRTTKTKGSQATIPVFAPSIPIALRCIERARSHHWTQLFPFDWQQAARQWNKVRATLGASGVRTATLRSLRRTFAYHANASGMPTATLQRVLRHSTLATTGKYLELVGGTSAEDARPYFQTAPDTKEPAVTIQDGFGQAISAYKATGATPEEVARFAKAMMEGTK